MDAAASKNVGQVVGLDFFGRDRKGDAWVIAKREDLASVHDAVAERWRSLLAAMSSGIAHADYDDPTVDDRERALTEYRRVQVVAPGASRPSAGRCVVFLPVEDEPPAPDSVKVAYAVAKLTDAWRSALDDIPIVEVESPR